MHVGAPHEGGAVGRSRLRGDGVGVGLGSAPDRKSLGLEDPEFQHQSLPDRFKKTDGGGIGNVQTIDVSGHGNADEFVAIFPGEATHPLSFRSEDNGKGTGHVDFIEFRIRLIGGSNHLLPIIFPDLG